MLRTLLIAAALGLLAAPLAPPAHAADRVARAKTGATKSAKAKSVAQKSKRKAKPKDDKKDDKKEPAERAAPEGARVDPRTAPSATDAPADLGRRGMSRIEFDDRLVQGQTNKANAIYLFERRESALRSLLKKRTDFHEEIDETLE